MERFVIVPTRQFDCFKSVCQLLVGGEGALGIGSAKVFGVKLELLAYSLKMLSTHALAIFLPLFIVSCSRPEPYVPSNHAELHSLYAATRKVDASVMIGASFNEYSTDLTDATTQLLLAKDAVRSDEKERKVLAEYVAILEKYQDALYAWSLAIQGGKGDDPRLIAIQIKFGLPTITHGNLFEEIRNQLWELSFAQEQNLLPVLRTAGVI